MCQTLEWISKKKNWTNFGQGFGFFPAKLRIENSKMEKLILDIRMFWLAAWRIIYIDCCFVKTNGDLNGIWIVFQKIRGYPNFLNYRPKTLNFFEKSLHPKKFIYFDEKNTICRCENATCDRFMYIRLFSWKFIFFAIFEILLFLNTQKIHLNLEVHSNQLTTHSIELFLLLYLLLWRSHKSMYCNKFSVVRTFSLWYVIDAFKKRTKTKWTDIVPKQRYSHTKTDFIK